MKRVTGKNYRLCHGDFFDQFIKTEEVKTNKMIPIMSIILILYINLLTNLKNEGKDFNVGIFEQGQQRLI